jgi:hypothetical protein
MKRTAVFWIAVLGIGGFLQTPYLRAQLQTADIEPSVRNLGVWFAANPPNIAYDTLINTGTTTFDIDTMYLKYGNIGFSIHDSVGGRVDLTPLAPGARRLIQIQFVDPTNQRQVDSIIFGNSCGMLSVAVVGSGGAADFAVTSQTWSNVLLTNPPTCYLDSVQIENLSPKAITIDSATWPDKVHFKAVSTFPVIVPPSPASKSFLFDYCPDSAALTNPDRTQATWYSHQVLQADNKTPDPRFDSLVGNPISPSETFTADTAIMTDCSQQGETIPITFTVSATGTSTTTIAHVYQSDSTDFFGLTGTLSSGNTWLPDTGSQKLQPGQSATITVYYVVPTDRDDTVVDYLAVVDGNGDSIATTDGKTAKAMVITNYYAGQIIPAGPLSFGPTLFQAPGILTKTFNIQNTAPSGLAINDVGLQGGNQYFAAYSITTVPLCPDTLLPGQSMTVTVTFNDSVSDDPVQAAVVQISSNSCTLMWDSLIGYISNSGVKEANTPPLSASIIRLDDGRALETILPTDIAAPANFELVNVLGESVLRTTLSGGNPIIDASGLPRGVYFYRITMGSVNQSGKVILGE